jgi:citrate synthase
VDPRHHHHTFIHENVRKRFLEGFHHDAHPMGMLVSTVAALSTFYPEAKDIHDDDIRNKQIVRLIAKMPTLAAGCPPLPASACRSSTPTTPRLHLQLPCR